MRKCDVGLVCVRSGVIPYAYPSKVLTYWSESMPVLAVVESSSQLAQTLESESAGLVCDPGDRQELARAMESLVRKDLTAMRLAASKLGEGHANEASSLEWWSELLQEADRCRRTTNL